MKTIIELAREAVRGEPDYIQNLFTSVPDALERFATLVKAAHTERLLAGVEMPEPFGLFCGVRHDPPKTKEFWGMLNQNGDPQLKCNLYTADQMQEFASCAALSWAAETDALKAENERLREALLNVARKAEALKKECGEDPESPQAIRNGMYMHLSYVCRAAMKGQP